MFPILSAGFTLFTEVYYRWWYMFTAVMALAACIVLENAQERDVLRAAMINIALVAVFFVLVQVIGPNKGEESAVYHMKRLIVFCIISASGAGLTWLAYRFNNKKEIVICLGITVFAVLVNFSVIRVYKIYNRDDGSGLRYYVTLGSKLDAIDP